MAAREGEAKYYQHQEDQQQTVVYPIASPGTITDEEAVTPSQIGGLQNNIEDNSDEELQAPPSKLKKCCGIFSTILRVLVVLLFIAAGITLIVLASVYKPFQNYILFLFQWIKSINPYYGCAILVAACTIFTLLMIPATLINLAGGFLFGIWLGTLAISIGCMIASIVAFFLGKTCLRGWVEGMMKKRPKLRAIDKAVEKNSFLIIFLTRLSPVLPYTLLNYAFGVTKSPFMTYTIATFLGIFPSIIFNAYLGSQLNDIADIISHPSHTSPVQIVWLVLGLAVTVIVMIVITVITKRALTNATKEFEEKEKLIQETKKTKKTTKTYGTVTSADHKQQASFAIQVTEETTVTKQHAEYYSSNEHDHQHHHHQHHQGHNNHQHIQQ